MNSYVDDFDVFVKEYNGGLKRSEIMFKLGWSERVYRLAYYHALRQDLIKPRSKKGHIPKFYFYDAVTGNWIVNGKSVDSGNISITCPSEESAVEVVDLLFKYGWCKSEVFKIKEEAGLLK